MAKNAQINTKAGENIGLIRENKKKTKISNKVRKFNPRDELIFYDFFLNKWLKMVP